MKCREIEAVVRVNKDRLRKWLWVTLVAAIAFQLYFVRELLAALFLLEELSKKPFRRLRSQPGQ
jgi:hypothetical protein